MSFKMPPEWQTHKQTWIAFPSSDYTLGETAAEHEAARKTWAAVANAASEFEPVKMVVNPGDQDIAKRYLSAAIEIIDMPINDAWIRDSGPSFTLNEKGELGAIDWVFNGWGDQPWAKYDLDALLAIQIAGHAGAKTSDSSLINEGGGFHLNDKGQVLLTETVQLGLGRNALMTKAEVEKEIHAQLGTTEAIWLKRGLTRDYDEFGTRGHVDIVACFLPDGRVMYHDQKNPNHPDYLVSAEVREVFIRKGIETLAVSAPETLKDEVGYVDYSYINHYVLNHGVLLCSFDDSRDKETKALMREAYPGREIVLVDARELFARGGGIHCITQQEPA